jgi:hypothetical protein
MKSATTSEMTVADLKDIAADLSPEVARCFGGHSGNVRLYLAGAAVIGNLPAVRHAIAKAVAGDRKARTDVANNAAYWLARWRRFGAVC